MKTRSCSSLTIIGLLFMTSHVFADPSGQKIASQGNGAGATACVACHGANGGGLASAGFPALAGQNADYLHRQLNDFASGSRSNPTMVPVAKALSREERRAVSDYFSSLPAIAGTATPGADQMKLGSKLAQSGNWDKDIPACFTCHGDNAAGIGSHFPALAGQHASYLGQQLLAWQAGTRNNDPNGLMKGVAQRLSEAEIKAVSAYLASLPAAR